MSNFRKNILIASLFLFGLYACRGDKLGNTSLVVTKNGGKLQSEIKYIDDTIRHGLAKYYYYPTDILKDEIEFNHGIKEGWHKHYRKDGTLESKVHYKNSLADGMDYRYYEDGVKIQSESFSVKGESYGLAKWYYKNGQLEVLNMTDFSGETFYVIHYDDQGVKIKDGGIVFSRNLFACYTTDSTETPIGSSPVHTGKEISIKIPTAQLPETKTTIRMGELNKGSMMELPIENYTATYKTTFSAKGEHQLVTIGEIKDLHGNTIKRDSITTAVTVVE
jgi:antitoxin component YwqK of YwqJK toxin-antitoxin module